jgi:alpha-L-rhamnosidase
MSHRKLMITLIAAAVCGMNRLAAAQIAEPESVAGTKLVITSVGAVGDGKTMNTAAIQNAIDKVASSGGGTVVIPEGTFLSGSIFLKPRVNLHLEKNGVLKGSTDTKDYPMRETRIEGHFQDWLPALVNAEKVDHLRITGEGTLDGSGEVYWTAFRTAARNTRGTKNLDVPRPRLVYIARSQDVQVSGIHFKDSGFWNLHVYNCNNVLIENLDIRAGASSPSTDGMDIDSSQNVTIKGCYIQVNDDCIALKGTKGIHAMEDKDSPPVEHIRISDCTFAAGGAFVTAGSEATIVRDVIVENCKAEGPGRGVSSVLRLKLRTDTPELYEDIHIRNVTLNGGGNLFNISPWRQYEDLQGQPSPKRVTRNISLSNVKGTFGGFGSIGGSPGDVIEDITIENVDVKLTNQNWAPRIGNVTNLKINNVMINGEPFTAPTPAPSTTPSRP